MNESKFTPGLEGVVAAQTRLSSVNGLAGKLVIGGYPLAEIAGRATFEEVAYLLWHDQLPTTPQLNTFCQRLSVYAHLPSAVIDLLTTAAKQKVEVMDALRMGVSALSLDHYANEEETAFALLMRTPLIIAQYWRLLQGEPLLEPDNTLSIAGNYLYLLNGTRPTANQTQALDTYLTTVVDHGLNASTFTARVIVSTQSDLISAVTGALGALKGPSHGGAPGPALNMVFDIGEAQQAEPYIRAKLERGERLMGFGHRVYKVRDPRAAVLAKAADKLYQADGDMALYNLAKTVEETAVTLLAEYKPGRNLQTNVEFYTALLLHGLSLPSALFTPTFAVARTAGWLAHCQEQLHNNRIFRPKAAYIGEDARQWVAIEQRG